MTLREMVKKNEGTKKKNGRHVLYKCTAKKWTCGHGRNAEDKGFSQDEVDLMLTNDIQEASQDVMSIFPHFYTYSQNRQNALIDMDFNLGKSGFLGFKKMIAAVKAEDWPEAAKQAKDSEWYKQVKKRAVHNVRLLREG